MTLVELLVVAAVLVTLAGVIAARLENVTPAAQAAGTHVTIRALRDAIMGRPDAAPPGGYLADVGTLPARLRDLFIQPPAVAAFVPATGLGWRGPYTAGAVVPHAGIAPPALPPWITSCEGDV